MSASIPAADVPIFPAAQQQRSGGRANCARESLFFPLDLTCKFSSCLFLFLSRQIKRFLFGAFFSLK